MLLHLFPVNGLSRSKIELGSRPEEFVISTAITISSRNYGRLILLVEKILMIECLRMCFCPGISTFGSLQSHFRKARIILFVRSKQHGSLR